MKNIFWMDLFENTIALDFWLLRTFRRTYNGLSHSEKGSAIVQLRLVNIGKWLFHEIGALGRHLSALLKKTSLKLISAKMLSTVAAKQSQPKPFKKAKFRAVSCSALFTVYLDLTFYKWYLHTRYFKQLKKYNFFTNLQSEKNARRKRIKKKQRWPVNWHLHDFIVTQWLLSFKKNVYIQLSSAFMKL